MKITSKNQTETSTEVVNTTSINNAEEKCNNKDDMEDCNFKGVSDNSEQQNEYDGFAEHSRSNKDVNDNEPYICEYCDDDITLGQIKYIIEEKNKKGKVIGLTEQNEADITVILSFLNKYKAEYKINTCLRKAHFIAQALAESGKFTVFEESLNYSAAGLRENFSSYFSSNFLLKKYFDIKSNEFGFYTTDEIKECIKVEYKAKDTKVKKNIIELLSEIDYKDLKVDEVYLYGKVSTEKIILDNNILKIYYAIHSAYKIKWPSRAYGSRMTNGKELSRDGYKFIGRGIIQITGKDAYTSFSTFRKTHTFADDTTGSIDFCAQSLADNLKGEFNKVSSELMYAVQSAVIFWSQTKGTHLIPNADKDEIKNTTYYTNGGYKHIDERNAFVKRARQTEGLKVFEHYREMYEKGSVADKKIVETNLDLLSKSRQQKDGATKKMIQLKDDEAEKLKNEIIPKKEQVKGEKSGVAGEKLKPKK